MRARMRATLRLEALPRKSSWALIAGSLKRYAATASRAPFGPTTSRSSPREPSASRFVSSASATSGSIRTAPRRTAGERFFGTLKRKLDRLAADSLEALDRALGDFRFFYNHVRPHQNLGGAMPAEAWAGVNLYASRVTAEYWFDAWDGLLKGYYLRR